MSQKVSPILFNTFTIKTSKWFTKTNSKFLLNEDLQIREIINIIFKNKLKLQYFFIDKIILTKYSNKLKIYIYFFCKFKNLKLNLTRNTIYVPKKYARLYFYKQYTDLLKIKKIEILKILQQVTSSKTFVYIYTKNIKYTYNNRNKIIKLVKKDFNNFKYISLTTQQHIRKKRLKNVFKIKCHRYYLRRRHRRRRFKYYFRIVRYFKTLRFILYLLCDKNKFLNFINVQSLLNLLYYELKFLDQLTKNYNFLFYNIFNLLREFLRRKLRHSRCQITGLRILIKGRYFRSKRKRIFVVNIGRLNLNKIDLVKDYASTQLIKNTGASSIKIWISYKNINKNAIKTKKI